MRYHAGNYGWFSFGIGDGYGWFRIFGVGLHVADRRRHPPLFSERMGYTKHAAIFGYSIKVLYK
jgi:hypothetical protein